MREQLVHSVAPFSDAARVIWGDWGATAISFAIILSAIGALNGWTLLMGQVPMAASRHGLFPPIFRRLSSRGVPAFGIIISAIFATLLVVSQVAGPPGFKSFYDLVVGISTMAAIIPYAFCALATGLVAAYVAGGGPVPRLGAIEVIAFFFSVLFSTGVEQSQYSSARSCSCLVFPFTFGSGAATHLTKLSHVVRERATSSTRGGERRLS